jgi:plasmid stabilization system protein ParE
MSQFVLTPAAEDDIREILNYIERDNPSAVIRVSEELRDAMRLIAERPGIGLTRTDLAREPVRFWPVFSYLVIYRPETKPLEIVRVLRGKRDVRRLLEE